MRLEFAGTLPPSPGKAVKVVGAPFIVSNTDGVYCLTNTNNLAIVAQSPNVVDVLLAAQDVVRSK